MKADTWKYEMLLLLGLTMHVNELSFTKLQPNKISVYFVTVFLSFAFM